MIAQISPTSSYCEYSLVKIRGVYCLYTCQRLNSGGLLDKYCVRELARSGDYFYIEERRVAVDFGGTLISREPLEEGPVSFEDAPALISNIPVVEVDVMDDEDEDDDDIALDRNLDRNFDYDALCFFGVPESIFECEDWNNTGYEQAMVLAMYMTKYPIRDVKEGG